RAIGRAHPPVLEIPDPRLGEHQRRCGREMRRLFALRARHSEPQTEGGGETREGDTLPLDGKALGALRFLPRAEAGLDAVSEHDPIDGISTAEQGEQQEQHENLAAHARVISGWACAVDAKARGGNARDALAGARALPRYSAASHA